LSVIDHVKLMIQGLKKTTSIIIAK